MSELAATMAKAVEKLGIDSFNLMGTSFGGKTALWLALQQSERVLALVLEAPAAIRPEGAEPPSGSPEEMARRLYAHPERLPPMPPPDPGGAGEDATAGERGCAAPTATLISSASSPASRRRPSSCSAPSTASSPQIWGTSIKS